MKTRSTAPEVTPSTPDGLPEKQQPKWRRDFPIDWPQDEYVSRRDLVKFMMLTSLAFVVGQFSLVGRNLLLKPATVPPQLVANVNEMPILGSKVFEYPPGSPPRLLLRLDEERFVAYDQQCTHLQCPVLPHLSDGTLHCPCHNGWFDAESGRPLAGPPRRSLPRITLEIRDGQVFATGVQQDSA